MDKDDRGHVFSAGEAGVNIRRLDGSMLPRLLTDYDAHGEVARI